MKQVIFETLIDVGGFTALPAWQRIREDIDVAIASVHWPPGSEGFTIFPQSGKKRGEGNGVVPIKTSFVLNLAQLGWDLEKKTASKAGMRAPVRMGAFDAMLDLSAYRLMPFVAEWETGNISSSHRALNKMALALLRGQISGGILVLPTRQLYTYLTDRVGNYAELEPYFELWSSLRVSSGLLAVISVEHDDTSEHVPRIPKGTDGRAAG